MNQSENPNWVMTQRLDKSEQSENASIYYQRIRFAKTDPKRIESNVKYFVESQGFAVGDEIGFLDFTKNAKGEVTSFPRKGTIAKYILANDEIEGIVVSVYVKEQKIHRELFMIKTNFKLRHIEKL